MSNTNSSCSNCGKGFNRTKTESRFCFCCPDCEKEYWKIVKDIEAKWCSKPKTNPAFEQVPK